MPVFHGKPMTVFHGKPMPVFHGKPMPVIHGNPMTVFHGKPMLVFHGKHMTSFHGKPIECVSWKAYCLCFRWPLSVCVSGGPYLSVFQVAPISLCFRWPLSVCVSGGSYLSASGEGRLFRPQCHIGRMGVTALTFCFIF